MAESNEPLLLFDDVSLDINDNPPNSQNSFSNNVPMVDTTSSILCSQSDSAFMETSNSSETSIDCIKTSKLCSEMPSNISNVDLNTEFSNNQKSDSGIHDSQNNMIENAKLVEFDGIGRNLDENCGVIISDFNQEENDAEFKDEDFHDAVQFFKDPSSLIFLENAGSSKTPTEPSMARSSLYQKFDPLHAKFFAQSNMQSYELQEITEDEVEPNHDNLKSALMSDNLEGAVASESLQNEIKTDEPQNYISAVLVEVESDGFQDIVNKNDSVPVCVNKHLSQVSPRQSLGNILISFDSPAVSKNTDSPVEIKKEPEPLKIYTEDEMQQALKIQELTIQETFLKKQKELESKIDQQKSLSNSLYVILKDMLSLINVLSDKEKQLKEKLEVTEKENNKLKDDLKTSAEDIQSVETTFSDFHKRYEQCKNMLKVYTENEKSLKQQLENMNMKLHEKEEMYKALQSRTQEMLDKANTEVANAKKTGDAQVAVLKAQLKKAELKISSLESDIKHVKIENGKLSSICDDLMAKVSET